jgi:acetoin utilization deacetylase AcuC-like enzyme/GNAT superfamily N-acetyltransferase
MFRIRRIYEDILPSNKYALEQVKKILSMQFIGIQRSKIDKIPEMLRDPFKYNFKSIVYVAENEKNEVIGFALLSHEIKLKFAYLDYIAAAQFQRGRGIGGALYQRIREEAMAFGAIGLFFECLPDDPTLSKDPEILQQNIARLKFYEGYGARPIINTKYETPVSGNGDNPPYLVFDGLGQTVSLSRDYVKKIVANILNRKYKDVCSPEYVKMVVDSFKDDPVQIRSPRYTKKKTQTMEYVSDSFNKIMLVVTDQHEIHHVKEKGYVESPVRIRSILSKLDETNMFRRVKLLSFSEKYILDVHDRDYFNFFKKISQQMPMEKAVYPYVFPIRNRARPPKELPVRAGYYCIDTFTPLNRNAFLSAKRAVECALTAAVKMLGGCKIIYALIRPPGHHAERSSFGGFCYFNNAAIAANYLSNYGKVAMLDIDYHHGNGQQMIFYKRKDVLTVSIHGDPSIAYPYFSGFANEEGEGEGYGFNKNYPLPEKASSKMYIATVKKALRDIDVFNPVYLIVCLGLDTAKGDPTGTWMLNSHDFFSMGYEIGMRNFPKLIVQEGGYDNRSIGTNAREFFRGIGQGSLATRQRSG